MTRASTNDIAIIIPARNEEDRIGTCLMALAEQSTARASVILVVNNTTDRTSEVAHDIATRLDLYLTLLTRTLGSHEGVGSARKIGCNHALQAMPSLRYLLTTDADCIVAPDWIGRNLAHLETVDAVCGKVDLIADEADILDGMDRHLATLEGTYRKLVQDIYAGYAPGCSDIGGTHGEAAGASQAFSKEAYLAVGGFAPIVCGEDRRIARDLRTAGYKVRHADDVKVQASCRLTGRAVGGMSDALKARISGMDYKVDDCLPPADWMIKHATSNTLGSWPGHVPAHSRLSVQDLPLHIELLKKFRNSAQEIFASSASVVAVPNSHPGISAPDRGSAIVSADPNLRTCRITTNDNPAATKTNMSAVPTVKGA